jgi:hypothetical protein
MSAAGSERFSGTLVWALGTSWEMLASAFTTFVIVAVYLTLLRRSVPQASLQHRTEGVGELDR